MKNCTKSCRKFLLLIIFILMFPTLAVANKFNSITAGIDAIDANFKTNNDLMIIFGDGDELAHSKLFKAIFDDNVVSYKIGPGIFSFDNYLEDNIQLDKRNLIIAGGPCANKFWNRFSEETCDNWPYKPGQAIAKLIETNNNLILLLAGTTKGDTLELAEKISTYKSSNLFNDNVIVIINSDANRTISVSDLCNQANDCRKSQEPCKHLSSNFEENVKYEFEFSGKSYKIMADNFDFSKDSVVVTINGIKYNNLIKGDELSFDNTTLAVCDFGSGFAGSSVELSFNRDFTFPYYPTDITFFSRRGPQETQIKMGNGQLIVKPEGNIYLKDVEIDFNIKLISSITINDKGYKNIKEGEIINVNSQQSINIIEIHPPECLGDPEKWKDRPPEDKPCFDGYIKTIIN